MLDHKTIFFPEPVDRGMIPDNETGLYLHKHKHSWEEIGTHQWPSGTVDPLFRCHICSDVICNKGRKKPEGTER